MKSFDNFFSEATEEDLRKMGASDSAVAELKRRKEKRGFGFDRDDDRAKEKDKKPSAITKAQKALPAAPRTLPAAPGTQSAPKKDVTAGIARTNPSSSRTDKEAVGAPKKSGPGVRQPDPERGPGSKTYDRAQPGLKGGPLMEPKEAKRRREKAAMDADEKAARREREIRKKLDKEDEKKERLGKLAKGAAKKTGKAAMGAVKRAADMGKAKEVGTAAGEDLEGLTGRDSGLIS